jgi:catechol 2,3-dioxygenase-like lactoylglutathione lyase family enzyme
MPLVDLHHVAIKARDLEATVRFYTRLLGMKPVPRPAFSFPGAWLKMSRTMFHFYGGEAAKNPDGGYPLGGAAVDHIALEARGFDAMRRRLARAGVEWHEAIVPGGAIWQLYLWDPNGVKIELNFTRKREPKTSRGPVPREAHDHAHRHHPHGHATGHDYGEDDHRARGHAQGRVQVGPIGVRAPCKAGARPRTSRRLKRRS